MFLVHLKRKQFPSSLCAFISESFSNILHSWWLILLSSPAVCEAVQNSSSVQPPNTSVTVCRHQRRISYYGSSLRVANSVYAADSSFLQTVSMVPERSRQLLRCVSQLLPKFQVLGLEPSVNKFRGCEVWAIW